MAETNSLAFPNMINVAQNQVAVVEDDISIVNRNRLLMLTDPTELYNSPDFGVGLRRYLFQYNNNNTIAMMKDRIKEQIRRFEPYVDASKTEFSDGLLFSENPDSAMSASNYNKCNMTVKLETTYKTNPSIIVNGQEVQK